MGDVERRAASLWGTLARAGSKATADSLDDEDFGALHVDTALDDFLASQAARGVSVVLTGNAGDGKTHALQSVRPRLEAARAEIVTDATASMAPGDVSPLIRAWREAHAAGRPLFLAANEYPLYLMRRSSAGADFAPLREVDRQCRQRLAYGAAISPHEEARERVVVVDLSLRNPLSPGFMLRLYDKMVADPEIARIGDDPAAMRNMSRLKEPRVRDRLRALFERLVARGHRATVRDLLIVVSRLGFGAGRGPRDATMDSWYSEVLFRLDDRLELARIMAEVDPARHSHPQWDDRLETFAPSARIGWCSGLPAIPPHPYPDASAFAALKRAFYFEHQDGEAAFELEDVDARDFGELLCGGRANDLVERQGILQSLNSAYCPVGFPTRDEYLYLWSGHRFHDQASRSFVASDRVPVGSFAIEIPRLPTRLEGCLNYEPDHVSLRFRPMIGEDVRLKIDFRLYRTLRRIGRGLPRKLVPERDVHRIDAFLEKLEPFHRGDRRVIWSAHLDHREVLEVQLSDDGSMYERIRRHD